LSISGDVIGNWPLFAVGVTSVIAASGLVGWLMTRMRVLPGTTIVWGLSPGAATAMTLLAESYGADAQLVAFMQYTRVILVAAIASVIAKVCGTGALHAAHTVTWFPAVAWLPLAETLALAVPAEAHGYFYTRHRLCVVFVSILLEGGIDAEQRKALEGGNRRQASGESAGRGEPHGRRSKVTMGEMTSAEMTNKADVSLEIRVLGDFAVFRKGEAVDLPRSRKTRALLAYLAVTNHSQRRERLCEMFWDVPDDPRGALRWSLSKIRPIVNIKGREALVTDRNMVALQSQSIALDLRRIKAISMRDLVSLDISELENLARLFRGGFLEDLSLARCPKFEAWRTFCINEINVFKARILQTVIDRLEGDASRALPYAHALQAMYPEDGALAATMQGVAERARNQAMELLTSKPAEERLDVAPVELSPARPKPHRSLPLDIRFCTSNDGVRIAYAIMGEGPPIVKATTWMAHLQFDLESPIWRDWIEGLGAQNRLIRYDGRGNGLSDREVDDMSFETMVADLEAVVDSVQLDRFALLGISQGCAISIAYAVKHPERVSHLVLCGGYAQGWRVRGDQDEIARHAAMATLMRQGWGKDNPASRQLFTALFVPEATHEQMDWLNELQRKTVSPENAARLYEVFANIDISGLLHQVTTPTLVLHARGDQTVPHGCGRVIADGIPGAYFVTLESSNHILLAHEPAFVRLLDEVRRFTARHGQRSALAKTSDVNIERKHVTVLSVYIVNPLQAFSSMDPELVLRQIDPLLESTFEIIEVNGGVISASVDYGITAVFGTLPASEHHAVSACQAALAVTSKLESQSEGGVRVRAGLDTGEVVIRHRRRSGAKQIEVTGGAVRTAARLAQGLRRGAVAVTDRTRVAAVGLNDMVLLSRSDLLSFDRDEQVYELKSAGSAE
jgi:pimeloyl-ACP methyl ester carboxylesterase/class 3 adenylate cyclase